MRLVKLVVALAIVCGCTTQVAPEVATAEGGLDRSFGSGGVAAVTPPLGPAYPYAAAIAAAASPDGASYVLARAYTCAYIAGPGCRMDLRLQRYLQDGSLDSSFGDPQSGALVSSGGEEGSYFYDPVVRVDARGRPVIAWVQFGTMSLVRLTRTGGLDQSFGVGGTAGVGCECASGAVKLAFATGDRIIISAQRAAPLGVVAYEPSESLVLARLLPGGKLDRSFGRSGLATIFLAGSSAQTAFAQQPAGATFLAGLQCCTRRGRPYLFRVRKDGKLDLNFKANTHRWLSRLFGPLGAPVPNFAAMVVRPHGRLDLYGSNEGGDFVIRVRADGRRDRRFGRNGFRAINAPVDAAAIDSSGGTFVVGEKGGEGGVIVSRLLASGRPDPDFGGGRGVTIARAPGVGVDIQATAKRRALIFNQGVFECRFACRSAPTLTLVRAGGARKHHGRR